jgi:ubiquinone/menaquinone biosynthesis C-methylase UbiE
MDSSGALKFVSNGLLMGAGAVVGSQLALRGALWWEPRPMPHQVAGWLDHPLRVKYRNPGATLALFGLFEGMTVLDLGCGTGLFTTEMARMVGQSGTVHAVDLQPALIEVTRRRVEAAGVAKQVRLHCTGTYALPLTERSIDVAVLISVLGEIPDRLLALRELRRVLKPDGRVAVSEELPDPAYLPAPAVRRWAELAGFRVAGKTGTPFCYSLLLSP